MMLDGNTCLVLAAVCGLIIAMAFRWRRLNNSVKFGADTLYKRVLIVTAHPDDECMFFGPVILNLIHRGQYEVFLLCLSSGNFYNQGKVRQQELLDSAHILGIRENNVFVLDRRDLKDDPTVVWDESVVSKIISEFVKEYYIDIIFTFDEYGVSGHANHKSLYYGVRHFLQHAGSTVRVEGYKLVSINILRKYVSILELIISYFTSKVIFVSRWRDVLQAQKAMYAHKSQFVWFRVLYIFFSRYMVINSFDPIIDPRTSCQN